MRKHLQATSKRKLGTDSLHLKPTESSIHPEPCMHLKQPSSCLPLYICCSEIWLVGAKFNPSHTDALVCMDTLDFYGLYKLRIIRQADCFLLFSFSRSSKMISVASFAAVPTTFEQCFIMSSFIASSNSVLSKRLKVRPISDSCRS